MSEAAPRIDVAISVPEAAPPVSIRVMRGGRLVHEFIEPELLPSNSDEPQGEVGT